MSKRIQTVLGPVEPEDLGITLMHEHVLVDLTCNFVYPEEASLRAHLDAPVTTSMLGLLRRRPFSACLDNVRLTDEETAVREIGHFARAGGQSLVDCTVAGIGRDPLAVARVARATGLNVILGTGVYVEPAHPAWVADMTMEELTARFINEIVVGIGDTGVRAGIIGEIGTSGVAKGDQNYRRVGDVTPNEEKVVRAAGRASVATGAAVTVHLDVRGTGAYTVMDVLASEGVSPDRMIMDHLDPVGSFDYCKAIADRGAFVELDCFGRDYYSEELEIAWGSDTNRVALLARLLAEGLEDQIVVSQDICMKMDLREYGGQGYDHLLNWGLVMFRRAHITEAQVQKLLVENPRRALAFDLDAAASQRQDSVAIGSG